MLVWGATIEAARENLIEAFELFFEAADPEKIQRRLPEEPYITAVNAAVEFVPELRAASDPNTSADLQLSTGGDRDVYRTSYKITVQTLPLAFVDLAQNLRVLTECKFSLPRPYFAFPLFFGGRSFCVAK